MGTRVALQHTYTRVETYYVDLEDGESVDKLLAEGPGGLGYPDDQQDMLPETLAVYPVDENGDIDFDTVLAIDTKTEGGS